MKKLLFVCAIASVGVFAHADFTNGSFETGDFTGWSVTDASSGSLILVESSGFDSLNATDGSDFAVFGAVSGIPDTISQTLATTVGQHYTLSFDLGEGYNGTSENMEVMDNGTVLYNAAAPAGQLTHFTYTITGTGSDTISFAGYDEPAYIGLDNVHLTPTSAPEPASMTLLGLGVAGMIARRRRAKN